MKVCCLIQGHRDLHCLPLRILWFLAFTFRSLTILRAFLKVQLTYNSILVPGEHSDLTNTYFIMLTTVSGYWSPVIIIL